MNWSKEKCPKCGRKGLHYANHPHAYGVKNYSVITCRFCHARYDAHKLTNHFEQLAGAGKFQNSRP